MVEYLSSLDPGVWAQEAVKYQYRADLAPFFVCGRWWQMCETGTTLHSGCYLVKRGVTIIFSLDFRLLSLKIAVRYIESYSYENV